MTGDITKQNIPIKNRAIDLFFVHLRNLFSDISNNMSICQHRVMPSFVRNIFCASLMQLREGAKKRLTVFCS